MTVGYEEIAVADAGQGVNLANGKFWATSKWNRMVTGMALTGSAAAGDTKVSIFYGTTKIAELKNSSTGLAIDTDKDLIPHNSNLFCASNDAISVIVDEAPSTNPIQLLLIISEIPSRGRY